MAGFFRSGGSSQAGASYGCLSRSSASAGRPIVSSQPPFTRQLGAAPDMAHDKKLYPRKQLFVDPKVQGAIIFRVAFYWLTCLTTKLPSTSAATSRNRNTL